MNLALSAGTLYNFNVQAHAMLERFDEQLRTLRLSLKNTEEGIERLYQAVEQGILPLDDTLAERGHKLKAQRLEILVEMANLRGRQQIPVDAITPKRIGAFAKALRAKLLDRDSSFGRQYLRLLVDKIVIRDKQAEMSGSYANLARVIVEPTSINKPNTGTVPSFIPKWRPQGDMPLSRSCLFLHMCRD